MHPIDFGHGAFETPFFPEDQETNLLNICLTVKKQLIASGTQGNDSLPPLFQLSRWVTGPNQETHRFYNRIKPALRLASLFITDQKAISNYWPRLLLGHHAHTPGCASTQDYLHASVLARVLPSRPPRRLARLPPPRQQHNLPLHAPQPRPPPEPERVFGATFPARARSAAHTLVPPSAAPFAWPSVHHGAHHPTIGLNRHFYAFFALRWRAATASLRYRQLFVLAQTLAHEVAHAFGMLTHPQWGARGVAPWLVVLRVQAGRPRSGRGWGGRGSGACWVGRWSP
ncbi:uncharacterized protein BDZ99DRAFT_532563 [Mytilinidion resinicola]|uniref:Uncharacterized protein n=1 Tax=Mytilinidion resinicola TaxID=574789 RepID=A0A6A6YLS5_9PEZI|nr:uncharacterized protein BDZ99DRAFT_532563 [Mytilinidion resinicola]KAF2809826.1 hypothetical protein BDZ99DRAFT_532563 [Mytilinidion resinicola]